MLDDIRVHPGTRADLAGRDSSDQLGLTDKDAAKIRRRALRDELQLLQSNLWAENKRAVLLVLQGMDTAGKDSTIRRVFEGVNPQGVRVAGFGKPSELELDHDYLWRVHAVCPRRGEIGIFNRSHYEDVGVVRVNGWINEATWLQRYGHIRDFEKMLADNGTAVRKVWLHVSRDEQRERLQARLDDPAKHWKFNISDLDARAQWDDYQTAYDDALSATSTEAAPWYVVPANRKWVRDVAVLEILVQTLREMAPTPPPPADDLDPTTVVIPT